MALREAKEIGIDLWAYRCLVNKERIKLDEEILIIL